MKPLRFLLFANIFLFLWVGTPHSYAQTPTRPLFTLYKDAVNLRALSQKDPDKDEHIFKLMDTESRVIVSQILTKYIEQAEDMEFDQLKQHYDDNVFISSFFGGPGTLDLESRELIPTPTASMDHQAPSPSSTIIDGVGRFLAQRFREELHVAFFERFRDQLEKEPILQGLFPQTATMLNYIDSYLYAGRIKMLGGAFQTDIDSLIFHVNTVVSDPTLRKKLNLTKEGYLAFKSLFLGFQIASGIHPANALYELSSQPEWDSLGTNLSTGLRLANILSEAFLTGNGTFTWVEPDAIENLKTDRTLRQLFLGLLFERIGDIRIKLGTQEKELQGLMVQYQSKLLDSTSLSTEPETHLKNFLSAGSEIPNDYLALDFSQGDNFGSVISNTLQTVNDILGFLSALNIQTDSASIAGIPGTSKILSYTQTMQNAAPYAINFYTHMRSAIEANSDSVRSRNFQDKAYYLGQAFLDLGQVFGELASLYETHDALPDSKAQKFLETAEKVFYYGTFVSTVLTTDDAEDVAEIIERFALPSGSSRIKRESPLNISINAFAGPSLGWETPAFNKLGFQREVMLFTAPIGIAISTSAWRNNNDNGASLSFFLSALDLGAVTLFRLNENNRFVSLPAAASFENVFAPGAHVILGFPDVPISAGIGFQRSASLRKITQDEVRVDPSAKYRLGVFLGVDIPMFNLYTNTSYKYSKWKFKKKKPAP